MVPGLPRRTRTPCLRYGAGLRAGSEKARCLAGVRRLGRAARLFGEIRQICGDQGDPCLHDFRKGRCVSSNDYPPLALGGATQINRGGIENAFSAGLQAGGQIYSRRLLEQLDKNPYFVRVPAGSTFYLYVTQTIDLGKATVGLSTSFAPSSSPKEP